MPSSDRLIDDRIAVLKERIHEDLKELVEIKNTLGRKVSEFEFEVRIK